MKSKNGTTLIMLAGFITSSPLSWAAESVNLEDVLGDNELCNLASCVSENDSPIEDEDYQIDTTELDQAFNIRYVPMPIPEKPLQITMRVQSAYSYGGLVEGLASGQASYWNRLSRGKVHVTSIASFPVTGGRVNSTNKLLELILGAHSHVPVIGNSISASHEAGHEFGLGHSSTRIWKTQTQMGYYKHESDPLDPMTTLPGARTINPPHIHFLKWFNPKEEAFAEDGGQYALQVFFDRKHINLQSLKTLFYQVPGSTRKYWFIYTGKKANGEANIAIYSSDARGAETYFEGSLPTGKTHLRSGLIFEATNITPTSAKLSVSVDPNWVLEN